MSVLPPEFQTTNLKLLTTAARNHLSRVLGNRALQKQQQAQLRQQQDQQSESSQSQSSHRPRQR